MTSVLASPRKCQWLDSIICTFTPLNSVAFLQAVGYYIRFGCDAVVPPLVVVITEEWMQIVLFPFRKGEERLVNGILLPKIDLWKAGPEIDEKVLWLLCLFSCPDHYVEDLTLPKKQKAVPKRKLKARILTEEESLELKVMAQQAEIESLKKQLRLSKHK